MTAPAVIVGRHADQAGDADEPDAEGGGGGPGAADAQRHDAADQRGRCVVPARRQDLDAVVHEGGDGAAEVPHPDQCADGQQDEDGARDRGEGLLARLLNGANSCPFFIAIRATSAQHRSIATWIGPSSASSPNSASAPAISTTRVTRADDASLREGCGSASTSLWATAHTSGLASQGHGRRPQRAPGDRFARSAWQSPGRRRRPGESIAIRPPLPRSASPRQRYAARPPPPRDPSGPALRR